MKIKRQLDFFECPYCNEWHAPDSDMTDAFIPYTVKCDNCSRTFTVRVYYIPTYQVFKIVNEDWEST